jgi:hypothetical protein
LQSSAFVNASGGKAMSIEEYLRDSKGVGGQYVGWLEFNTLRHKAPMNNCTIDHMGAFGQGRNFGFFPFQSAFHMAYTKKLNGMENLHADFPKTIENVDNSLLNVPVRDDGTRQFIYIDNNKIQYAHLGRLMPGAKQNNCEINFVGDMKIPIMLINIPKLEQQKERIGLAAWQLYDLVMEYYGRRIYNGTYLPYQKLLEGPIEVYKSVRKTGGASKKNKRKSNSKHKGHRRRKPKKTYRKTVKKVGMDGNINTSSRTNDGRRKTRQKRKKKPKKQKTGKSRKKIKKNGRKRKSRKKKKKRFSRNAGMTWEELSTVQGSNKNTSDANSITVYGLNIAKGRLFQTDNPTHVDLSGLGINDDQLKHIIPILHEVLRNKISLNLSNNKITNVRPLRNLNLLESLNISNQLLTHSGTNEAMDLKAISDLENLQSLSISNIKDIMPLVDLDKLKFVWLPDNNIKNIEKLSKIKLKDIPIGLHRFIVDKDEVKTPEQKRKGLDGTVTVSMSPHELI